MKLLLHDVDETSVTLAWSVEKEAVKYELQLMQIQEGQGTWTTVSDSLKSTTIRKKNLAPNTAYAARVRARDSIDWGEFCASVEFTTMQESTKRMSEPTIQSHDSQSITISWAPVDKASSYTVQYRSSLDRDGCPGDWEAISAAVKGCAVRKKNLNADGGYHFRVMPNFDDAPECWAFSRPSEAFSVARLPLFTANLLGHSLIDATGQEVGAYALAGQTVGIYAGASWCGPCRQFTGNLATFYNQARAAGRSFQVVFVSCDRDEQSFLQYFKGMPWLAVPYKSKERESALSQMQVQAIPRLIIVSSTGQILDNNAVQTPLTLQQLDMWAMNRPSASAAGSQGGCSPNCCGGTCSK